MSSSFARTVRLAECATFQEGYVNPSQQDPSYFGDEVKWLRATDLNNSFVFETGRRLSRKGFDSAGKSATLFAPGTLAISKSGTIGRIGILQDYMCGNRAVINIKPNASCDTRFIFYSLLLNRNSIEMLAEGSVQKNLYVSSLGNLKIELPNIQTQKSLASILGVLDDRIALLRETNATLEAIAQALFKSWFVDFDPVHAKQQGIAPAGMDEGTAALFPDSFEESELGPIPKGWGVQRLGDVVSRITKGTTPTTMKRPFVEAGINFVKAESMTDDGGFIPEKFAFIDDETHELLRRSQLEEGDVLISIAGTIGRIATMTADHLPANTNQAVALIRPRPDLFPSGLVSRYLQKSESRQLMGERTVQAVQANLSLGSLSDMKVVLSPPQVTLQLYLSGIAEVDASKAANHRQMRTLAALRDTLLPRLISGQLRIPDADAVTQ